MAVTEGWMERAWRSGDRSRAASRVPKRSLKAALSDAGLGEGAEAETPETRRPIERVAQSGAPYTPPPLQEEARPPLSSPRVAYFADQVKATAVRREPSHGVVSPPPWLREARRGRLHAFLLNTFGWMMALVVAGSIIGVAGRYLAVTPPGADTMQTARQ